MDSQAKSWSAHAKHWLVLFGIPLIILLIGAWQWSRADHLAGTEAKIAEYQAAIGELEELQRKNGRLPAFVKDENGQTVAATLMRKRYEKALAELQGGSFDVNLTSRELQPTLALFTMVCSALALLWSIIGVLYQKHMGRKAMESRAQLLATFERGRKLLPLFMVVMVLLTFAAAIPMLVYEIMPILRHRRITNGDMKIVLVLAGVALFLLYSGGKVLWDVWRAARKPLENDPIEVMGQAVTRAQVPQLWGFVDRVVSHTGAGMPDAIVVGLNEGFFVTEHPVKLSNGTLLPKGRVLYLPLPYMAFMSAAEVAAVIGHELGHFIGEDTVYSQRFSPIYAATVSHIVAVAGGEDYEESWLDVLRKPATLYGEMFLDSFHEAVSYWSRQRELAADAVGAAVAHPIAIASSLLRITALEPHVSEALHENWDQGKAVEGGVLAHVRQLVKTKGMVDPSEHLQNRQSHPTDTHPELAVRLEALGLSVTPALLERAMDPSGSSLLQELGLEQASAAVANSVTATAPVVDVSSALQQELSGAAAEGRAQKIEELSSMVRETFEPKPVTERALRMLLITLGFTAVGFLVSLSLLIKPDVDTQKRLIGAGMLLLSFGGLAWAWYVWSRTRRPALVVRREGLQLFDYPELLAWDKINDFTFTETNNMFVIALHLDPDFPSWKLGVSKLRASYGLYKKKNTKDLTINLLGIAGKRAEQLAESIMHNWRAHYASLELERMGIKL